MQRSDMVASKWKRSYLYVQRRLRLLITLVSLAKLAESSLDWTKLGRGLSSDFKFKVVGINQGKLTRLRIPGRSKFETRDKTRRLEKSREMVERGGLELEPLVQWSSSLDVLQCRDSLAAW